MSDHKPPVYTLAAIFFGILAVSTASILIRFAQQQAGSLVIAAYRLTIAAAVLAPVVIARRRREIASLSLRSAGLIALSGIFLALHFFSWISSLSFTTVASSVVLVSTTPLWVGIVAPFVIKEPLSRPLVYGMALAFLGGTIVGLSDTCTWVSRGLICPSLGDFLKGKTFIGDLLAIAGAITAAGYLIIGRQLRSGISLLTYIFLVYGVAAVVLVFFAFVTGQQVIGFSPMTYVWFVALAIVPQLLGHSTFNWALKYLSAAFVSLTLLGEPIGSTILAYFILDETPTLLKIIGAILILIGIVMASRTEQKPPEVIAPD